MKRPTAGTALTLCAIGRALDADCGKTAALDNWDRTGMIAAADEGRRGLPCPSARRLGCAA